MDSASRAGLHDLVWQAMSAVRLVVVIIGWLAGWWLLGRLRGLAPLPAVTAGKPIARPPVISLVVPARDEAATLPVLLASLRTQSLMPDQVVVVDDGSADATAEVARMGGADVVAAPALPAGWAGKAWACQTGADATTGDLLVFLDADTSLAPDGLARLAADQRCVGGLISVQPWHRCVRPVESLSALFNVVALMGVGAFATVGGGRPSAGAFGPVLACSRTDYDDVGGHRSVRAEVVEDVWLACRFRASGFNVTCRAGLEAVSFRMYPEGLGQLIEGWTKNLAEGARRATRPGTLALIVAWLTALASVAIGLTAAAAHVAAAHAAAAHAAAHTGSVPPIGGLVVYVLAYVAVALQMAWMLSRAGRFRWWAWGVWPVPMVVFVAVFIRSAAMMTLHRPVRWKGRRVPPAGASRSGHRNHPYHSDRDAHPDRPDRDAHPDRPDRDAHHPDVTR